MSPPALPLRCSACIYLQDRLPHTAPVAATVVNGFALCEKDAWELRNGVPLIQWIRNALEEKNSEAVSG